MRRLARSVALRGGPPLVRLGLGPVALVLLLVWLPFGFRLGALIEEWSVLAVFVKEGPVFWVGPDSQLVAHQLRPLTVLPHAIAFALDADSFDYWHAVLIAVLAVKGACCAGLLWWATRSALASAFFAMLVLVYPADTMQLSFRALHINASLALLLLACLLQLHAARARGRPRAVALATGAGVALVLAAGMYEAALMLAPLPVLLAGVRFGWRRGWRWWWSGRAAAIGWGAALAACVAYMALMLRQEGTYQAALLRSSTGLAAVLVERLSSLLTVALPRALWGGWLDAARIARDEFHSYAYLGLAALAMAAMLGWSARARTRLAAGSAAARQAALVPRGRIAACGLALLVLGYAPYLASLPHLHTPQRTYLFATPGAALVLLALVLGGTRTRLPGRLALGALLLAGGLAAQLFQFHQFLRIYDAQRGLLAQIVRALPERGPRTQVLVRDASASLADLWMLRISLDGALTYLLDEPVERADICIEPGGYWQKLDDLMRPGACIETPGQWILRRAAPVSGPGRPLAAPVPDVALDKDRVHAVRLDAGGHATGSQPDGLPPAEPAGSGRADRSDPAAAARLRMLTQAPRRFALDPFRTDRPADGYRWDVGRYWGIAFPQRGVGWREADWIVGPWRHGASVWKTQAVSTLLFDLAPAGTDYRLTGRFSTILSADFARATRMRLNGTDLAYRWTGDGAFEARVSTDLVRAGTNAIEFDAPVDPGYYGLSMALERVGLQPAR